jgi:glucosamine 6-phosphate synthetase-like amidotransferase/phosphosugar isomerase protein
MTEMSYTLTQSWPVIKEDLMNFLSDTDAWIIAHLKDAYMAKDWEQVHKVIDIMESVHHLSHGH